MLLQEFYIYGKEVSEILTLPMYQSLNAIDKLYISSNILFDSIITIISNYITSNQRYTDDSEYSTER